MIHLDLLILPANLLRLPHHIHQAVHRALIRGLRRAVQDRYAKHQSEAISACSSILGEDSVLAIKFGLAVEIGWAGGGVGLVGGFARFAGEDVVG